MALLGQVRFVVFACVVSVVGCLRIVDLDDDGRDAIVVSGDAFPPIDGAWDLDCAVPLPCPVPAAHRATLCGRILDAETDEVVAAASPTRQACTGVTTSGPCSLRVRYFDAIDFAADPNGAIPLVPETSMVDDCGRFRATNMMRAPLGFIAIVVDDAVGIMPAEAHVVTGVAYTNELASQSTDVRAFATRRSTEQLWSMGAGLTGQSFAQRGVLLKVFVHQGEPVAGVTVRRNDASVPADDYYFADAGRTRRLVDPVRSATGPNGSVLVLNSPSPTDHGGAGSEPAGCQWPRNLGASIPGVVSIDVVEPETPAGAACP